MRVVECFDFTEELICVHLRAVDFSLGEFDHTSVIKNPGFQREETRLLCKVRSIQTPRPNVITTPPQAQLDLLV